VLDWSAIITSVILSAPATVGAYFAAKSKKYSKVAAHTGSRNESKIADLTNGLMDEKIKRATRQVLNERRSTINDDRVSLEAHVKKSSLGSL